MPEGRYERLGRISYTARRERLIDLVEMPTWEHLPEWWRDLECSAANKVYNAVEQDHCRQLTKALDITEYTLWHHAVREAEKLASSAREAKARAKRGQP